MELNTPLSELSDPTYNSSQSTQENIQKKKKGDISNKLNLESNVNSNSKSIISLKSQKILSLNEKKKFNNKNKINKNKINKN
jgi:hypothetical protein